MGKPAARLSDYHSCPQVTGHVPHVGGPIAMGATNVFIGGSPAATIGAQCVCNGPPDAIAMGSSGVFINGKPAARMGDMTAHGGVVMGGCPTVLIGEGGALGTQASNSGEDSVANRFGPKIPEKLGEASVESVARDPKNNETKSRIKKDKLKDELEKALKNSNMQKFLHVIRQSEHNAKSIADKNDDTLYWKGFGSKPLETLQDHPAILQGSVKQMYAGAYQIGKNTWQSASNALGLENFEPHSQDLAAAWLIKMRGQLDNVLSGNVDEALPSLSVEWRSLPMGPNKIGFDDGSKQTVNSYDDLKAHYDHYEPDAK